MGCFLDEFVDKNLGYDDNDMYIYFFIFEEKSKTQNNPKFDDFIMKVDIERFDCNNLLQDFKFMKNVKIAMDVSRRKEIVYKKKDSQ